MSDALGFQDNATSGFAHPTTAERTQVRERGMLASLIATIGLMIGTVVAATAVSIGFARAGALDTLLDNDGGLFIIALLLGALFVVSTLTKACAPRRNHTREYKPRHR